METVRKYTAGFLFIDTTPRRVLLVRKTHPKWQNNLLNGIGGEMHPHESPLDCMVREFYEETGFESTSWNYFCKERGPGYEVFFYRMLYSERVLFDDFGFKDRNMNDNEEPLEWHAVPLKDLVVGNLNWLIPMALDPRRITNEVHTADDIRRIATW